MGKWRWPTPTPRRRRWPWWQSSIGYIAGCIAAVAALTRVWWFRAASLRGSRALLAATTLSFNLYRTRRVCMRYTLKRQMISFERWRWSVRVLAIDATPPTGFAAATAKLSAPSLAVPRDHSTFVRWFATSATALRTRDHPDEPVSKIPPDDLSRSFTIAAQTKIRACHTSGSWREHLHRS